MEKLYHGKMKDRFIFSKENTAGEERDYHLYRIPGIVVTKKGTVIAYCEARTNIKNHKHDTFHTDYNLMDIIMRRSTDNGETFSESIYLARGNNEPGGYACVGNPVMIVDNDNVIHFLYSRDLSIDGGGLWYRRSYDDGLSWTEAKELGNFADELGHEYNAFVFGPTHGICTADGTLVVSVWEVERREHNPLLDVYKRDDEFLLGTHIFYSTDGGDSWHITKEFCFDKETFAGELSLALLSDKRSIYANVRTGPGKRLARKINNILTMDMEEASFNDDLIDPGCCSGVFGVNIENVPYGLLYSGCESEQYREDVTLFCSFDEGDSFRKKVNISGKGHGGYSDVYANSEGKIFVIWEDVTRKDGGVDLHLTTLSYADEFLD